MVDLIIGVAVLYEEAGVEHLFIRCQCADGSIKTCEIPVHPKGSAPRRSPSWEYVIAPDGSTLTGRPSVNWVDVFHNQGEWSVAFVRFETHPEKFQYPGDLYRHLNGPSFVDVPGVPRFPDSPLPAAAANPDRPPVVASAHGLDRWVVHHPPQ